MAIEATDPVQPIEEPQDKEYQLKALIEEYKEMRNEIRSTYGQYFSILFGIIFSGIFGTFYIAFEKNFLFLFIPFMIGGWICIIIVIRMNIQHIAVYIKSIEKKINVITRDVTLKYETDHAKLLWFSNKIKFICGIPAFILFGIAFLSVYKGSQFLRTKHQAVFWAEISDYAMPYVYISVIFLLVLVPLFVSMPENVFKKPLRKP